MSKEAETLYSRLGGSKTVRELAGALYFQIFSDPRLARFFNNVDAQWLLDHQVTFLSALLGATDESDQIDLYDVHRELIADGLSDEQFDRVARHLRTAALDLGLRVDLINELMAEVGSLRDSFFGRHPRP